MLSAQVAYCVRSKASVEPGQDNGGPAKAQTA